MKKISGFALRGANLNVRCRRCSDNHCSELNSEHPDLIPDMDPFPVTPITPPAAFLPPGFKYKSEIRKGEKGRSSY